MYDIIIAGAGPAGLTAAIYALRAGRRVLLIERGAFGGQMTYSPKIENYPTVTEASGNELADRMVEQVINLGGEFEIEEVTQIRTNEDNGTKTVIAGGREFVSRAVILANGVHHRMLGLDGEQELIGKGISFCAVCDGAFYRDRDVAVIGGGNSALQEAVLLSEVCKSVTVVQNLSYLTGEKKLSDILNERKNVRIITNTIVGAYLTEGNTFKGIRIKNTENGELTELICDGVFIAIGLAPENDAFGDVAVLTDKGYFSSGEDCTTKTPGVFVAGDCRNKRIRQITTATADGAVAALAACNFINNTEKSKI